MPGGEIMARRPNCCPRCSQRVPNATERCLRCGAHPTDIDLWRRRRDTARRTTAVVVALLSVLALLAIGYSDRYLPAVSEWYTRMAIQYLPDPAARLLVGPDSRLAYHACARSVVRRVEAKTSVVTFGRQDLASAVALGEGRYRIRSYLDEAREDGAMQRRAFSCTVRLEGSRWVPEAAELETGFSLVGE
jgi:hypothetical protein